MPAEKERQTLETANIPLAFKSHTAKTMPTLQELSLTLWELEIMVLKELGGQGQFLRPDDLRKGVTSKMTIVEAPRIVPSNFKYPKGHPKAGKTKEACRVTVKLPNGERRAWTLNNTTYNRLLAKFGKSEKAWIGKVIYAEVLPVLIAGKRKLAIYGASTQAELTAEE